jgi:tRNA(Met) C34 N-acetyltransferase TmcA
MYFIYLLYRYSNIFVTAPSPENLKTVFEFIFKGFDALEYQVIIYFLILSHILNSNNEKIHPLPTRNCMDSNVLIKTATGYDATVRVIEFDLFW